MAKSQYPLNFLFLIGFSFKQDLCADATFIRAFLYIIQRHFQVLSVLRFC